MTIAGSLARGGRAVWACRRTVAALYLVQLGLGLIFSLGVWLALIWVANRPAFTRGVSGDDLALLLALATELPTLRGLAWGGVALLVGWLVASWFLEAGLRGALAGRPFAATAAARGPAFGLLWLCSILPYGAGAAVVVWGVMLFGPGLEDAIAVSAGLGKLLLAAAPGLVLMVITAAAMDQARAELAVGAGDSLRALRRGFAIALSRRAPLACYLLYLAFWLAVGWLYVSVTAGRSMTGMGPAFLLLVLRQAAAGLRFVARSLTCGAQMSLQLEVVELRELAKRPEARGDLG